LALPGPSGPPDVCTLGHHYRRETRVISEAKDLTTVSLAFAERIDYASTGKTLSALVE